MSLPFAPTSCPWVEEPVVGLAKELAVQWGTAVAVAEAAAVMETRFERLAAEALEASAELAAETRAVHSEEYSQCTAAAAEAVAAQDNLCIAAADHPLRDLSVGGRTDSGAEVVVVAAAAAVGQTKIEMQKEMGRDDQRWRRPGTSLNLNTLRGDAEELTEQCKRDPSKLRRRRRGGLLEKQSREAWRSRSDMTCPLAHAQGTLWTRTISDGAFSTQI